ncbi:MAG: hypothetical protein L0206_06750 [Actinobacteria bacterium]|nr:hypothetical protein [Actinomycetota bacterium]
MALVAERQPLVGTESCEMHHVGYALSGTLHVVTNEGEEFDIGKRNLQTTATALNEFVTGSEPRS